MTSHLRIGALLDFDWGYDIFKATIDMLNDPYDGMWDGLLDNETFIEITWENDNCSEATAVGMYWNRIKTNWTGYLPHAVIGCHCSSASLGLARAAGLDNVPVVSMSSTSYRLSDEYDFKNFFRTVAPDDDRGQVGALVALFQRFGWNRVSVIGTNSQFSRDMATKFGEKWTGTGKGTIAYSTTISLQGNDVDDESVRSALDGVPTNNPLINSRVILLIATPDHASRILELAIEQDFQPDTIWIGSDGWEDLVNKENIPSLPRIPGYLTLVPFHNQSDKMYKAFLDRYNQYLARLGATSLPELKIYAAETVDAILVVVHALLHLSPAERNNGSAVVNSLYNTNFTGLTGHVAFDKIGRYRKNAQYELQNLKEHGWESIPGIVTPDIANVSIPYICWSSEKCNRNSAPSPKYDVPPAEWMYIVFPIIALLMLLIAGLSIKYLLARKNMTEMQKKLDAIDKIDEQLANIEEQGVDAKERRDILLREREELQEVPGTWSTSTEILNEIFPEDEQYWTVARELRKSMEDAWISRVWRVQNKPLWAYYSFHKHRMAMNRIDDNELAVWHGTSSLEPSIIHSDTQDGFMMQLSRIGLWGRGIYFATKSSYSDMFCHKPDETVTPHRDEREIILAKLLVGNAIEVFRGESQAERAECSALTVPPINLDTGMKYNTVKGWSGGSDIWVVYENGRAYPDYLVRYYKRPERDPIRTPFASKEDWARQTAPPPSRPPRSLLPSIPSNVPTPGQHGTTSLVPVAPTIVWEYENDGWHPMALQSQAIVESAYLAYKSGISSLSTQTYKVEAWTYEVDFDSMMQTNIDHNRHRQRRVQRTEIDVDV